MFSLANKIAVITGAASGIGRAVAQVFARQGAIVHLVDLNDAGLAIVVAEIQKDSAEAVAHIVDVTDQVAVDGAFQKIGRIDILVNSAGVSNIGKADATTEGDFDRVYRVNVKGTYNCIHAALPLMQKNKSGVILNLASIAANIGLPERFAYSMSKGAVIGMTLSVAKDYINEGIRCNSISPARVHTPFVDDYLKKNYPGRETEMYDKLAKTQPIGRMARPEEIAYCILYLCSDEASFITGCDYPIDGGFIKLNN